jgi:hypothetical protein
VRCPEVIIFGFGILSSRSFILKQSTSREEGEIHDETMEREHRKR